MNKSANNENSRWPFKGACEGISPAIVMFDPRDPFNVGAAVRAASCFGVSQVWITSQRCAKAVWEQNRIPREERMKGFADVDIILDDRLVKRYLSGLETALPIGEVLAEPRGWPVNNPVFEVR